MECPLPVIRSLIFAALNVVMAGAPAATLEHKGNFQDSSAGLSVKHLNFPWRSREVPRAHCILSLCSDALSLSKVLCPSPWGRRPAQVSLSHAPHSRREGLTVPRAEG